MSEITVAIDFYGGPLDGSSRQQSIPADWEIVRYEHRPICGDQCHVYVGRRERTSRSVELCYAGVQKLEASK